MRLPLILCKWKPSMLTAMLTATLLTEPAAGADDTTRQRDGEGNEQEAGRAEE